MKIYHAGGDLGAFTCMGLAGNYAETTGYAIAGVSAVSMIAAGSENWFRAHMLDPATQEFTPVSAGAFWLHFILADTAYNWNTDGTTAGQMVVIRKSDGTPLFRLLRDTGLHKVRPQYWDGAAWQMVGTDPYSYTVFVNHSWDFQISGFGANSTLAVYCDKYLVGQTSGVDTSTWNVAAVDLMGSANGSMDTASPCYQGVVCADSSTLDVSLRRRPSLTANGADTAWTNGYAEAQKTPWANDNTFIIGTNVGDKETFEAPAPTAPGTTYDIKAVVITTRLRNDAGAAPQNAKTLINIGGTDYPATGNLAGIGTGFNGAINIYPVDPSTNAAWGATVANLGGDYGVQAVT